MRIRKNRKLSSLLLLPTAPEELELHQPLQTHVCQLNQSPWDVIPFSSSSSSYLPHHDAHQFGGDGNGFTTPNGCSFVGAVQPVDSDEKSLVGFGNGGHEIAATDGESSELVLQIGCSKMNGKYFHDHHVSQLESYGGEVGGGEEKPARARGTGAGLSRAARKKKHDPASGANQFYYYSGFGPSWGKKRSGRERESPSSQSVDEGISYHLHFDDEVEDEDEDKDEVEEEMGDGGCNKKRVRKPVKARSLKSLM